MRRKPNTVGGGSRTNENGLSFEGRTDLLESFNNHPDFKVKENQVFQNNSLVGEYYEKHKFYKEFLEVNGVDWKNIVSKKYLPDSVFVNYRNNTVYVIEKKFQEGSGSVDEKLLFPAFQILAVTALAARGHATYRQIPHEFWC